MRTRLAYAAWALVLIAAPGASLVHAQTGSTPPPASQFDFLNPGARSLAMGSAFTGLADDATAALTNPAGLTMHLSKPEISFEGRFRHTETSYLQGGRLSGSASGQGIDTISGPAYGNAVGNQNGVSFLSFCYPSKRWAVSVYRHETLKADDTFKSNGVFLVVNNVNWRYFPWDETRTVSIVRYGAAGSFKITDKFSVGAGVAATKFSLSSSKTIYNGGSFYGQERTGAVTGWQTTTGDNTKIGYNVGVLFMPTRQVGVGLSYRRTPGFDFSMTWAGTTDTGKFQMPDEFAFGIMLNPKDPLKIVLDITRVRYSMLNENNTSYLHLVYAEEDTPGDGGFRFSVPDSTEFHAGAEYVLTSVKFTPAIRAGMWYEPFHSLKYSATGDAWGDQIIAATQPDMKATVHATAGAGLSLSRNLEVNIGGDFASKKRIVSASAVVRF